MTNFINTLPARWETLLRAWDRLKLWVGAHRFGLAISAFVIALAGTFIFAILSVDRHIKAERAKVEAAKAAPAPKQKKLAPAQQKKLVIPPADVEFPGRDRSHH